MVPAVQVLSPSELVASDIPAEQRMASLRVAAASAVSGGACSTTHRRLAGGGG